MKTVETRLLAPGTVVVSNRPSYCSKHLFSEMLGYVACRSRNGNGVIWGHPGVRSWLELEPDSYFISARRPFGMRVLSTYAEMILIYE